MGRHGPLPLCLLAAVSLPPVMRQGSALAGPPAQPACHAPTAPAVQAAQRQYLDAERAGLEKALATNGLQPLPLSRHTRFLHRGMRGPEYPELQRGTTWTGTMDGVQGRYYVAAHHWSGSVRSAPESLFVIAAAGKGPVRILLPQPTPREAREMVLCGVPPCPKQGSPCPACGSTSAILYGPLPEGATVEGHLTLPFEVDAAPIRLRYEKQRTTTCPRKS